MVANVAVWGEVGVVSENDDNDNNHDNDEVVEAEPDVEPQDALDRLAKLKDAAPEDQPRTPYWLGLVALLGVIGFLWAFPSLLDGGASEQQRLEDSLGYCKYREDKPDCERRIRARYEVCAARHEKLGRDDYDAFGECMTSDFPEFYLIVGRNKD